MRSFRPPPQGTPPAAHQALPRATHLLGLAAREDDYSNCPPTVIDIPPASLTE